MSYIPRTVPTDFQSLFGFLGIALLLLAVWFFFDWMERYAEKKEREIEKELEELDETGELY
jgi:Na+/melibiose symporter-like transporter